MAPNRRSHDKSCMAGGQRARTQGAVLVHSTMPGAGRAELGSSYQKVMNAELLSLCRAQRFKELAKTCPNTIQTMDQSPEETALLAAAEAAQSTPQDSLRELNRLLESALRMGGGDEGKSYDASNTSSGGEGVVSSNEEGSQQLHQGGEWRLDTARRLGGVSSLVLLLNVLCGGFVFTCLCLLLILYK
jgi:hypothetical protein